MNLKSLAAATLATVLSFVVSATADVTSGLVLKLDLNETTGTTATDSSGLGNNATVVNFIGDSQWTPAWANGGLKINNPVVPGAISYLTIPDAASLNFNTALQFTIATWVKMPPGQISSAGLIAKGSGGGGEQYALDISASRFRIVTRSASGATPVAISSASVIASNWTHVVVTWNGSAKSLRMFINGQYSSGTTNNLLATSFAGTTPLTVGARLGNATPGNYSLYVTNTFVDDVRLYNRSLTDADVYELYSLNGRVPSFTAQPRDVTCYTEDSPVVSATVDASNSTMPVKYQWVHDGTNILAGATNASLVLTNVQLTGAGTYFVQVSNVIGVTNSLSAVVQVQNPPPADLTNGLVGHWKFDETAGSSQAVDSSSQGNAAALTNFSDLSLCWGTGLISGALTFTNSGASSNNVVVVPGLATAAPAALDFSSSPSFTLAGWVKGFSGQLSGAALVSKGNGGQEQFICDVASGFYRFTVRNSSGTGTTVNTTVGPNNTWQHVAAVFNAANGIMSIYVNSQWAGSAVAPVSLLANSHEVSIGNRQSGSTLYNLGFNGTLDDVRIYNRNLSTVDIAALYLTGGVYPPEFVSSPAGATNYVGDEVRLVAVLSGTAPIAYQWRKDGVTVSNATNSTLTFTSIQLTNAGSYTLFASNAYGTNLSAPAVVQVSNFSLSSMLAAHWQFDDGSGLNAVDASANGNTGSLVGFPGDNSQWLAGRLGGSLNFNAAAQGTTFVSIPDAPSLNFSSSPAFTISAWVRGPFTQPNGAAIVAKGTGGGGEQYVLDVQTGMYRLVLRSGSGVATQLITAVPPNGSWQHVVATYDGAFGTAKIYVNGQLAGSLGAPSSLLANNHEVSIGNRQSGSAAYNLPFTGMIDDVRIYSRALNSTDITQLYAAAGAFTPVIYTLRPSNVDAYVGDNVTFTASADGDGALTFVWQKNNSDIPGATNQTLSLQNLQFSDAGTYKFVVSNATSSAFSNATLQVNAVPAPNLTSNLVAYWPFEETSGVNSADVSGNGNNLVLMGVTDDSHWEAGRIGGALHLNRGGLSSQSAGTEIPLTLQNGNLFSFSFWAQRGTGAFGVNPRIINPVGNQHWVLWTPNRGVGFYVPSPSTEPSSNSWNHYVVTYNRPAGTYTLYVNGVREITDATGYVRADPLDPIYNGYWVIGRSENNTSAVDYWNGLLDEMRVYNRVLNLNDARALYFAGGQPSISISRNEGSITLTWSAAASGFQLRSANVLGGEWSPVSGTPVVSTDGISQSLTLPVEAEAKFFRLQK